jgi:menaquinone-dependent protoporphyrinogen IX oxidase
MKQAHPRTLVVFFSRNGRTGRIAQALAERLHADVEEIQAVQSREGLLGYAQSALEAMATLAPAIAAPRHDSAGYELVVIGSPVWCWSLSSPVRTWLLQAALPHARVAFFCTMGASGASRVFDTMASLTGKPPLATLALTEHEVDQGPTAAIDVFVRTLQRPLPRSRRATAQPARARRTVARAPAKARA